MSYKEEIIWLDKQVGILEFIVPFMIVFTVLYAVMEKVQLLGKDASNLHLALAAAISLLVTGPAAYYGRTSIAKFLQIFIPWLILIMFVFVLWAILVGAIGMEVDTKLMMTILGILVFLELIIPESLIIAYITGVKTGLLPPFFYSSEFFGLLVSAFVLVLVVWFITREEKKEE